MNYQENLQELKGHLSIKEDKLGLTHKINKRSNFFPFGTRATERSKFKDGFDGVLGEFTRNICEVDLAQPLDLEKLVKEISLNEDINDEEAVYFQQILRMFLQDNNGTLKIFHPHIFLYLPLNDGKQSKNEKDIAKFLFDIFIDNNQSLRDIFKSGNSNDLVSKLVLNYLQGLSETKVEQKYSSKIKHITKTFQEDLTFLSTHEDYFKNHFSLLVSYYYFFYITQLTLKVAQRSKADYEDINSVYYTLDWEPTSKSRRGYLNGYPMIKDAYNNLLIDINVLEHLNILFGMNDSQQYTELQSTFNSLSVEKQSEFKSVLCDWIKIYREQMSLSPKTIDNEGYEDLVQYLYNSILEAYQKPNMLGPRSRYPLSIEEIGKKYFMKTRGSLGYMLNVTQDLILLLAAVCIKNEKQSLKNLFKELELRGLFFDRYSKEEIVNLFNKLNLLDKKSDSGDAQYVKPIL